MTTTWCWPPTVRVLPRHGINAVVKKDNKVWTFLQTCEYLPWILVSLFAQQHTKTIPVEFQTSERRLACSHPRLGFQSSEKAKKKQHSNSHREYQQSRYDVTSVGNFLPNSCQIWLCKGQKTTTNNRRYLKIWLPIGPIQTKTGDSSRSYWRSEHVHYASFFWKPRLAETR